MRLFDQIIEKDGHTLGLKEVAIFGDNLLTIGVNYQTWIQRKDGIFYLIRENRVLF